MQEFKDWKEFINEVLIESGEFKNPITEFKGVSSVDIEYIIKNGNVTQEIIETTKVLNPDLVVIGQKGNGARIWEGFWIGGTTQRFIKKLSQSLTYKLWIHFENLEAMS